MSDSTVSHLGRRLTAVPDQQVERGGRLLQKMQSLIARGKQEARRELLTELFDHYKAQPYKVTTYGDVASHLLEVLAAEIDDSEVS